jgi:mRNA interferase HigB
MRVIAKGTLREFWNQNQFKDSEQPLKSWYDEVKSSDWQTPQDVKRKYRTASFLANNRIVFNIHGNKYRLIVAVRYELSIVYIRFIGTHKTYDAIDAATI